ncbi:MAG TPA: hypothetical protein VGB40_02850 [Rubrobacteraceae bacterium]
MNAVLRGYLEEYSGTSPGAAGGWTEATGTFERFFGRSIAHPGRHPEHYRSQKRLVAVRYFSTFSPIPEDAGMVLRAVHRSRARIPSLWKALSVEVALRGGVDQLLTEDLQHGQVKDGVRFENPFLLWSPVVAGAGRGHLYFFP